MLHRCIWHPEACGGEEFLIDVNCYCTDKWHFYCCRVLHWCQQHHCEIPHWRKLAKPTLLVSVTPVKLSFTGINDFLWHWRTVIYPILKPSDTEPIWYLTYQIRNLSMTELTRYQTYQIPNLSDAEPYQIQNLSDTTYQIPNISNN